jgi:hypothetical protein
VIADPRDACSTRCGPEVVTDVTTGAVVSICSVPAGLVTAPERLALLLAASCSVAQFRLNDVRRHREIAGVLSGANRVAEAQCTGPGAAPR